MTLLSIRARIKMIFLIAFALTSLAVPAHTQSGASGWDIPEFTATQIISTTKYEISMQVYRANAAVRAQYTPALARLLMPGAGKVYNLTVNPGGGQTCVASSPDSGMGLPNLLELLYGAQFKRTPVGKEVVEGHETTVENVVATRPDGKTIEFKAWVAADLKGIPVKLESQHTGMRVTAVYRDIVFRSPDAALFAIPARCIPLDKMGQVVEYKVYQ